MNPNLNITRKTYYALGLLAAAASAAGAFGALAGQAMAFLDNVAFALTGMMFLLLAAVKGSPKQQKGRYFACFMLLILSSCLAGPGGRLLSASYWPVFLWVEVLRDAPAGEAGGPSRLRLGTVARTLTLCEGLACLFWMAVSVGGLESLMLVANVFWLLTALTRGWAAMRLYKGSSE